VIHDHLSILTTLNQSFYKTIFMGINLKVIGISVLLMFSTCILGQKKLNSLPQINIGANVKNMQKIYLSQFTNNLKYIPLEFSQDNPIGVIYSITFSEKYILINDSKTCLLFDIEGHFIRSIGKRGRGPGEYQLLICSRLYKDRIYLQSIFDLFEYKTDGTFVRKIKNRFMFNNSTYQYTRNWIIINDSLFFSHMPNPTGNIQYKALLTNNDGEIIKLFTNHILFYREKAITISDDNAHIYKFDKMIYFKEYYNDTLFYLDCQYELIPEYVFNLGKYKEPLSGREKPLAEWGKSQLNFIFIPNVFQTDKYLFIKCQFGDHFPAKKLTSQTVTLPDGNVYTKWYNTTYALGIYNIQTKTISFCEPTSTDNPLFTSGIYNDIDAGPRFFPDMQVNDSTLVMWLKPSDLINHIKTSEFKNNVPKYLNYKKQLEDLTNNLSDLDNPVLMLVTFKE
jgi:hypothetical protein